MKTSGMIQQNGSRTRYLRRRGVASVLEPTFKLYVAIVAPPHDNVSDNVRNIYTGKVPTIIRMSL